MAKNFNYECFYDDWTKSRSLKHDFLGDLLKCISLSKVIPSNKSYKNILEIGCGFGFVLEHFSIKFGAKPVGLDISQKSIDYCKKYHKGKYIKHDIDRSDLPFSKNQFDLIILSDVIEHVQDPKHLILESLRVGKEVLIKLPLQHRPRKVPDKNGHLHFWPYHTDALLWLGKFPLKILDFSVGDRREVYDFAIYHKKGVLKVLLKLFRWFNQFIRINIPREESINVYAVKK